MRWGNFVCGEVEYDLSHLHPLSFDVIVPAQPGKPQQVYRVNVIFGMHCFTRKPVPGETYSADLEYEHEGESRVFCSERHALSMSLPEIMRSIGSRKCFHTNYGTYFIVEAVNLDGKKYEYAIFFKVSKASKGLRLNVYVQSAYRLDGDERVGDGVPLKKSKPIKFMVIAHNTCTGKAIKPPR